MKHYYHKIGELEMGFLDIYSLSMNVYINIFNTKAMQVWRCVFLTVFPVGYY